MRRLLTATVLTLAAMAAAADQTDPRLTPLFDRLKEAREEEDAVGTANEIWKIWFEYRDAGVARLLQQAVAAKDAGDVDNALEVVNRVIEIAPDFAEAWNQRAIIYYKVGYFDASLADVEETLKLEPRHFGALSGRGMCYLGLRDPDEALSAFEEALDVYPWLSTARAYADTLRQRMEIRRRNGLDG
ncbi:MAG: tetratricopeptide repeat protein [Gammaproteobacteria bacterium]|nr:tetratricopeptide repeat protein [Gammaproteobacteria bacterium]